MNTDREAMDSATDGAQDFAALDQLFAQARDSEALLSDDNFTKMVINKLPARPERINKTRLSYDLVGMFLGGLMALFLIDFKSLFAFLWNESVYNSVEVTGQVINSVTVLNSLGILPNSFELSIGSMLVAGLVVSAASLAAWFIVEKSNSVI